VITASELKALLARMLAARSGGSAVQWRTVIGDVKIYPITTHPHCNWEVRPSGTAAQIAAVERAVDTVRDTHRWLAKG
jgi:hypothetical protein